MNVRAPLAWSAAGLIAAALLPWYALEDGLASGDWLSGLWSSKDYASGVSQAIEHGRWWLAPALLVLVACLVVSFAPLAQRRRGALLVATSCIGLLLFGAQAFAIGLRGWSAGWLVSLFGEMDVMLKVLAPKEVSKSVKKPDPGVLYTFEAAALTDGRLER